LGGLWLARSNPPVSLSQSQQPSPHGAVQKSPLDRALRLIAEARKAYDDVDDYTCVIVKRETIDGQLMPENVIAIKFRKEPFSVHMRWKQPKPLAGQEACYVEGRNNGMMRAKGAGLLGAVGFVNIDPKDPRTKKFSKHSITEAGIGNLIERYAQRWGDGRELNRTRGKIGEYEFKKDKGTRREDIHPERTPGTIYS